METQTQATELALIVEKSGLEETTANSLIETFQPFFEQAKEWNEKAKAIKVTDATQVTEMKQAREARLAIKGIRTTVENRRKELKEDSLRKGKAIDGVANLLKSLLEPTEAYLQEQEDFAKIAEAKRKSEAKAQREELLKPYGVQTDFYKLDEMDEQTFLNLLHNSKAAYEKQIEDARLAEEQEKERQRVAEEKRQEMSRENERLRKEAEERERIMREERLKAEQERKAAEEKAEAEQKAMREEAQRKLAAERAEREKVEAELNAKKEAEAKTIADKEAAEQAELSMGDKEKFQRLVDDIQGLVMKYPFKSKKYKALGESVDELLNKTINWAISKQ